MGAVTLNDNNAKLDNLEKAIRAANERRRKLIENRFEESDHNCHDKAVLDVLSYYQIKRP